MRYLVTILLFFSLSANATNYYVSNSGSDANTGMATGMAWQTLSKINLSSFSSGDSIFLKRGDTWNERLIPPSSNIYFGVYGTGNAPLITGFQSLTGLTNVGNIWSATATNSVKNQNMILINGSTAYKARYPNTGYLTFSSYNADTSITGTLTGTPNYTGKEIVVRTNPWILDKRIVKSQSGGTIIFTSPLDNPPANGGNGYFFQNDTSFLDIDNEWVYDSASKKLSIYKLTSPSVQISTIDTLVWVKKDFITFDGIIFTGANQKAFQLDTARGITIKNCGINYSGAFGVLALKSNLLSIINTSVLNCYSNGIYGRQLDYYTTPVNQCDSATVTNCTIKNIGTYAGMGESSNGRYNGIYIQGVNRGPQIVGNTVDSVGYIGIDFHGKNSLVKNNVVSNFCFIKNDGGGIYTVSNPSYLPVGISDNSLIDSNIVFNGTGNTGGTVFPNQKAEGIYLDDGVNLMTVNGNTVYNTTNGIFLHNNSGNTVTNNTLFNNKLNEFNVYPNSNVNQNLIFSGNKIFTSTAAYILFFTHTTLSISNLGAYSGNHYSRPPSENNIVSWFGTSYNLSGWKGFSGQDGTTNGTPTFNAGSTVLLKYNPTFTTQVYSIVGDYVDIIGTQYSNSITLKPFQSAILFQAYTKHLLRLRKIYK